MSFDDLFHNRKPKSCTFPVFSAGGICLVKSVPHLGQAVLGDSYSVILHRNENLTIFYGCFNVDRGIVITEFDCIVQ